MSAELIQDSKPYSQTQSNFGLRLRPEKSQTINDLKAKMAKQNTCMNLQDSHEYVPKLYRYDKHQSQRQIKDTRPLNQSAIQGLPRPLSQQSLELKRRNERCHTQSDKKSLDSRSSVEASHDGGKHMFLSNEAPIRENSE